MVKCVAKMDMEMSLFATLIFRSFSDFILRDGREGADEDSGTSGSSPGAKRSLRQSAPNLSLCIPAEYGH